MRPRPSARCSSRPGRAARADPGGRAPSAHRRSRLHRPLRAARRAADRQLYPWNEELDTDEGWAKYNRYYWLRDYRGFLEYFFSQMFTEPHSTKPIEDCIGWGLETTAETLVATQLREWMDEDTARDLCRRVRCPVRVIQGSEDAITGPGRGSLSPRRPAASSSCSRARGTARTCAIQSRSTSSCASSLPCRGRPHNGCAGSHAASARCTSRRRSASATHSATPRSPTSSGSSIPDLEIDWLAQHPVTKVLEARGERIHPGSALLANESSHIESECAEHDLHCFQAIRRMDEILLANFMVFHDLIRDEQYDLWIGDEAGSSTTTCTRIPSRSRPPTCG